MSIYLGETPLADGASTALLAGKADTNLENAIISSTFATKLNSAGIRTVVETYKNGLSWYRVWSDGWIEQGNSSVTFTRNTMTISFLKPFKDSGYTIITEATGLISSNYGEGVSVETKSSNSFTCHGYNSKQTIAVDGCWYACGY